MKLRQEIAAEMTRLSHDPKVVFIGENLINSGRIYGTLEGVPNKKCIEMPICENLIAGAAIGLALEGYHPICIFQRMDFMLIAADAIINHACMLPKMSGGSIKLPIVFRTIKANLNERFYVGLQHSKDFTHVFEPYMQVYQVPKHDPHAVYANAFKTSTPYLVVEDYSRYDKYVQKSKGKNT
jgi:pyruvate/2-oxoglutarate/acetoin dehydrogenase E1 component